MKGKSMITVAFVAAAVLCVGRWGSDTVDEAATMDGDLGDDCNRCGEISFLSVHYNSSYGVACERSDNVVMSKDVSKGRDNYTIVCEIAECGGTQVGKGDLKIAGSNRAHMSKGGVYEIGFESELYFSKSTNDFNDNFETRVCKTVHETLDFESDICFESDCTYMYGAHVGKGVVTIADNNSTHMGKEGDIYSAHEQRFRPIRIAK